jgi:hypothetical protein
MDLLAYELRAENKIPERIQNLVDKLKTRTKIRVRSVNMSDFDNEIRLINDLYNDAWQYNWGFVPMEKEEFIHLASDLRKIIEPDLVLIAEYENQPVAFSLALPDINLALRYLKGRLFPAGLIKLLWHTKIRNKINWARMITFGVVPQFQKRGVDSLMFTETFNRGIAKGYRGAELSWILETNELMCRGAEQMGGRLSKRYRIVEMPL